MKSWSIVLLLLISFNCVAQNRNSVWCFGDSAGIDFSNINNPLPVFSAMDERGSCASISDTSGNLLFYCFSKAGTISDSGTYVFNFLNDTIINGTYLAGQALYSQVIIIPMPGDTNKFYIFHLGYYSCNGLYYSIVDMSLNGGQGRVIQKNIQLNTLENGDCIQAIRHGNGKDWWLITKLGGSGSTQLNRFFVFKLSPGNNISSPIIQNFGNALDADFQKISVNGKGNRFMNVNVGGYMCEFDFDRCTGVISNPNIIFQQQTSNFTRYFVEGAYSPNDSLFYVSTWWYSFPKDTSRLLQYNLYSPNIPSSCDTLFQQRNPNIFGAVRLAPDHRIYMTCNYNGNFFPPFPYPDSVRNIYNENLSVINNPNNSGTACNFQPFSFYLGGKRTYFSLPNNPNYELAKDSGSICDTLTVGINSYSYTAIKSELVVYFQPQWQTAFINAKALSGKKYSMSVYDVIGNVIFKEEGNLINGYFTKDLNMQRFAKGMYIVNLQTEKENLVRKFLRE